MNNDCLFCRIVAGTVPARKVFEDDHMIAFHGIHPIAKTHVLLVPKRHMDSLLTATVADQALLGHLLTQARHIAFEQGLVDGFRTMINSGAAGGQTVFHLHVHVFGGGGRAESMLGQLVQ